MNIYNYKCLIIYLALLSLTYKTLNTCAEISWYTQITLHAQVGFWDKFHAVSFALIHKCKLCSCASVKLGHLCFLCPVGFFSQLNWAFLLLNKQNTLLLENIDLPITDTTRWAIKVNIWLSCCYLLLANWVRPQLQMVEHVVHHCGSYSEVTKY